MRHPIAAYCVALALTACAAVDTEGPVETRSSRDTGEVRITIKPSLARLVDITRVDVHVAPDDLTQTMDYNATSGGFSGLMTLAPGAKTLTGRAYVNEDSVGQGSAAVEVVAGQTAAVLLQIFDTSGAQPENDIAPIIQSVTISNVYPVTGETVTLGVAAVDLNGDPLTYAWSDDCAASAFDAPTLATTGWQSEAAGTCNITVTVYATGYAVQEVFSLAVLDPALEQGSLAVSGEFVPAPYLSSFHLDYVTGGAGSYVGCEIDLYAPTQNGFVCPALEYDMPLNGWFYSYFGVTTGTRTFALTDDCGGSATLGLQYHAPYGTTQEFTWTPPAAGLPRVCRLTATASYYGLDSAFDVGLLVDF